MGFRRVSLGPTLYRLNPVLDTYFAAKTIRMEGEQGAILGGFLEN